MPPHPSASPSLLKSMPFQLRNHFVYNLKKKKIMPNPHTHLQTLLNPTNHRNRFIRWLQQLKIKKRQYLISLGNDCSSENSFFHQPSNHQSNFSLSFQHSKKKTIFEYFSIGYIFIFHLYLIKYFLMKNVIPFEKSTNKTLSNDSILTHLADTHTHTPAYRRVFPIAMGVWWGHFGPVCHAFPAVSCATIWFLIGTG